MRFLSYYTVVSSPLLTSTFYIYVILVFHGKPALPETFEELYHWLIVLLLLLLLLVVVVDGGDDILILFNITLYIMLWDIYFCTIDILL